MSQDATPELVELANFLWEVLDESGMSIGEVQARFTKEHFPGVYQIPSVSTVYKRLRCDKLENAGRLVDAIIDICTPPERLEAAKGKAALLKSLARTNRPLVDRASPSDDCKAHLTQLTEAQQRIIAMQEELFRLKEGRHSAEKQDVPDLARLIRELDKAQAERRQFSVELTAARHEIQALKAQLAVAAAGSRTGDDLELERVEGELRRLDPSGTRFAAALRRAFDVVYDGARTGRFSPNQLSKVEKTHLLTVVEFELRREFSLAAGKQLDLEIDGIDVDCRFSQGGTWSIPSEVVSQLCLLVSADDARSTFSVGLLRVTPEMLSPGQNLDRKRTVSAAGRATIRWIVRDGPLPENVLLHTDGDDVAAIFAERTGQARVVELFRRVQNRRVDIACLRTVAMQEDAAKKARDARLPLSTEGVVVLGHSSSRMSAALELPKAGRGEFMSVRLARRRPHHGNAPAVELEGEFWVVATPEDPVEPVNYRV